VICGAGRAFSSRYAMVLVPGILFAKLQEFKITAPGHARRSHVRRDDV
jgi:hypothetical protein